MLKIKLSEINLLLFFINARNDKSGQLLEPKCNYNNFANGVNIFSLLIKFQS